MLNDLFRNIRIIVEDELKNGTENFIIYPFSDVGHLVREVLEWDYGKKPLVIDQLLSEYNKKIYCPEILDNVDKKNSVVLFSKGSAVGHDYFTNVLKKHNIRYRNVNDRINIINVQEKAKWFKELDKQLMVRSVKNKLFIRVGRDNDGGYVMVDDFADIKELYSFGISRDVSFEKDIASYGIQCMMFDHTIDGLVDNDKNFCWKKKGIAGVDDPCNSLFTLETLMRQNNDLDNKKLILKMDVEGAEWDFLKYTSSELLTNFKQIVFELHGVTDLNNKCIIDMLGKLRCTHTPVWLHGNNCCVAEKADDIVFASAMEVLYLNNKCYDFYDAYVKFPWNIDMPNNPSYPEIILGEKGLNSNLA